MRTKPTTDQKTKSLGELMSEIKEEKLVLPEFQRDYVWQIDKSITLFDSIFRGLFIGSLIISKPRFDLVCKTIDIRKLNRAGNRYGPRPKQLEITKKEFETKEKWTLLDGQQRATSLYRALTGLDPIFIVFKKISLLTSSEYFDKSAGKGGKARTDLPIFDYIESIRKKEPKDEDAFYIKLADLFHEGEHKSEDDIFDDSILPVLNNLSLDKEDETILKKIVLKFHDSFQKEIMSESKLLSVQLIDMDLESFCLYFERSNSQGVNLTFTDIITAKVYLGFKLSQHILKAQDDHEHLKDETALKRNRNPWWIELIIRYLNYLDHNEVTRGSILKNLTADSFSSNWENSVNDLQKSIEWLVEERLIINNQRLPYNSMAMPIVSFLQNLSSDLFSAADVKQIHYLKLWFYLSILDGRYGGGRHGSTNVVLKEDCDRLKNLAKGKFPSPEFWRNIRIHLDKDELLATTGNNTTTFQGILAYLNNRQTFKNFKNDSSISTTQQLDVHHIFPRNFIKDNFSKDQELVDSILNKMLLCKKINIGISDKDPNEYLNQFLSGNGNLKTCLDSHLIPHDLLTKKGYSFQEFLDERYKGFEAALKEIEEAREKAIADEQTLW